MKFLNYIRVTVVLSIFLWIWNFQSVFAAEEIQEPRTIREMQESIQALEKEKTRLEFKWNTFQIGNESLWDLIKQDISIEDTQNIEEIVFSYSRENSRLERSLDLQIGSLQDTNNIENELLELKKNFYKSLIPFIQINKLEDFKRYIDLDLSYNEKSKLVSTQIEKKQLKRIERVEELQVQIELNNKILREKIEQKISIDIKEKIESFILQDSFIDLNNDQKRQVFAKVINKIELEIINMKNKSNATSIIEEKTIIFEIVVEILKSYTQEWK